MQRIRTHGLRGKPLAWAVMIASVNGPAGPAHRTELEFAGAPPVAAVHDNSVPAGTMHDGVLHLALDAQAVMWHPDGDSLPGIETLAFAVRGSAPVVPGPLVRIPAGTRVAISVRNRLAADSLVFRLPSALIAAGGTDSLMLAPGETREIVGVAAPAGTFAYRAATTQPRYRRFGFAGMLAGALVVDGPDDDASRERVMVIQAHSDSLNRAGFPDPLRAIFAINGRAWPHTERLMAAVGDTLRWRVVNASPEVHPMHMHGFYFRVDAVDGMPPQPAGAGPGRMVVTERLTPGAAMRMTWVPEREGNWIFHCHFPDHVLPHRPLGGEDVRPAADDATDRAPAVHAAHANHALTGMGGLVVGIHVRPRTVVQPVEAVAARRELRLVAREDAGSTVVSPSMRFTLEEPGRATRTTGPGISPVLDLVRGEAVAITITNALHEPTAVHWHGVELESYFDGVAGFGGTGARTTPIIAPGSSFVAHFTPPRAGTFMYHSHVDEPRQHRAGLLGAMIVRDPGADASTDVVLLVKTARTDTGTTPSLEVNGRVNPDTVVLQAGRAHRLRLLALHNSVPNLLITLTRRTGSIPRPAMPDSLVLRWRPLAKDGAELPPAQRVPRPAVVAISMGETYDSRS